MKAILTGLALLATTALADHPQIDSEPIFEGDKVSDVSGAEVKWGHYEFFKRYEQGMKWDYYTYTPYCNNQLGHPFLVFDRYGPEGGNLFVYDHQGKEIDRMHGESAMSLPSLIIYQQENYKCPI